jgi:SAM-dependent methyltransferase
MRPTDPERCVCFDRAADYYDDTRSLPAAGRDRVLEILRSALPDGGLCLDVGVGTGRTAVPLTAEGVRVVGIDLSLAMMAKAVAKGGGRQRQSSWISWRAALRPGSGRWTRTFGPAADRARTWAEERFGALDHPRSFTTTVQMREYRVRPS